MPTQEAILTLLVVAITANVVLMAAVLIVPRIRRRSRAIPSQSVLVMQGATSGGGSVMGATSPGLRSDRPDSAIDDSQPVGMRSGPPGLTAVAGFGAAATSRPAADAWVDAPPAEDDDDDGSPEPNPPLEPNPLVDPQTGLDSHLFWSRAIHDEAARTVRYGRPATVVLTELDGLERLVARFGQGAADRLVLAIAATMRREARLTDRVARLGPGQFGALLPETDEVQAINFVERVRSVTDVWLEAGAVAVRLAIGWANVGTDQSLEVALRLAENRLNGDRRVMRGPAAPRPMRPTMDRPSAERPAS